MRDIAKGKFMGPFIMNIQSMEGILVHAVKGALRGLRREKEGWFEARVELLENLQKYAPTLRISSDVRTEILTLSQQLDEVRELQIWAESLADAAKATKVLLEDQREGLVKMVVDAVRTSTGLENQGLVVAFQNTIRYYGQLGAQAAKARAKNKAAAEAAEMQAAEEAEAEDAEEADTAASGPESQAA